MNNVFVSQGGKIVSSGGSLLASAVAGSRYLYCVVKRKFQPPPLPWELVQKACLCVISCDNMEWDKQFFWVGGPHHGTRYEYICGPYKDYCPPGTCNPTGFSCGEYEENACCEVYTLTFPSGMETYSYAYPNPEHPEHPGCSLVTYTWPSFSVNVTQGFLVNEWIGPILTPVSIPYNWTTYPFHVPPCTGSEGFSGSGWANPTTGRIWCNALWYTEFVVSTPEFGPQDLSSGYCYQGPFTASLCPEGLVYTSGNLVGAQFNCGGPLIP